MSLSLCGVSKRSALRLRLTGSVVQSMNCYDLLCYKAIGSNYLSFVVTSMLVSTSPLDEAGTATICKKAAAQNSFLSGWHCCLEPVSYARFWRGTKECNANFHFHFHLLSQRESPLIELESEGCRAGVLTTTPPQSQSDCVKMPRLNQTYEKKAVERYAWLWLFAWLLSPSH